MSTYKTKKIDELDIASELQDGCQIPICQDGTAKKLTGAQLKAYIKNSIEETTGDALDSISAALDTVNGEVV